MLLKRIHLNPRLMVVMKESSLVAQTEVLEGTSSSLLLKSVVAWESPAVLSSEWVRVSRRKTSCGCRYGLGRNVDNRAINLLPLTTGKSPRLYS